MARKTRTNGPYKTVLDAVKDGWRIIKFPELL